MINFNDLPFARYQFNFQVEIPLHLNFYSGSMLRGAFGHALRHLSCMTKLPKCADCMLYRSCPYPMIFETPPQASSFQNFSQIPNPYIIEPPPLGRKIYPAGDVLSFNMVLIGQAMAQLPLIIFAWQRALAFGLGKERSQAHLLNVIFEPQQPEERVIYDTAVDSSVQSCPPAMPPALAATDAITLEFVTPLRIQKMGKTVSNDMTARDFLNALVRRYYLLQEFHGAAYQAPDFTRLAAQAERLKAQVDYRWCDWQRYSHRQQQDMKFGGVLGKLTLHGEDLPIFLPYLQAGQWLHVGNKTTFGMGRYSVLPQP